MKTTHTHNDRLLKRLNIFGLISCESSPPCPLANKNSKTFSWFDDKEKKPQQNQMMNWCCLKLVYAETVVWHFSLFGWLYIYMCLMLSIIFRCDDHQEIWMSSSSSPKWTVTLIIQLWLKLFYPKLLLMMCVWFEIPWHLSFKTIRKSPSPKDCYYIFQIVEWISSDPIFVQLRFPFNLQVYRGKNASFVVSQNANTMCLYSPYRYFHRCSFPFSLGVYCYAYTILRIFDSKLSVNCAVVVMELLLLVMVVVVAVAGIHSYCACVCVCSLFDCCSRAPFQRFLLFIFSSSSFTCCWMCT